MVQPQPKLDVETDVSFAKRHWAFLSMIGAFLFADLVFASIGAGAVRGNVDSVTGLLGLLIESAFVGAVMVQPILLAFVLALFPGSLLFRLVLAVTSGLFCLLSLAIGFSFFGIRNDELYGLVLAIAPILVLSCSVPFLIAKFLFGWELVFSDEWENSENPQISIINLIVATALAAGSVSMLNLTNVDPIRLLVFVVGYTGIVSLFFVPVTTWVFCGRRTFLYVGYACFAGTIAGFGADLFLPPMPRALAANELPVGIGGLFTWTIVFYGMFLAASRMSGLTLVVFNQHLEDSGTQTS